MVQEDVRRPYVDFAYYKNDYGGTQIKTENDFKRAESISEAFVNQVTFGRIARLSSIIDSIKDAICCVADTVAVQNEKREAVVKSESNDGYSISVRISTEDIDDIVTTALEGGICYWCRRAEVKGKYLGEFASEQISRGGVLVLHDSVDGKKRELNKEKLLSGVKQYLEDEDKPYNILVDAEDSVGCSKGVYELDCCMVDATVADMIIQYAIFDDIIYG